jgi:protein arginine N-methyltransferase 1
VSGVTLSTAPGAPRTHWEQLYFPLLSPLAAKGGQTVAVELRSRTAMQSGTDVAWTATLLDGKGGTLARQVLNLDKGYLP